MTTTTIDDLFPSQYLKATDIQAAGQPVTLTIAAIAMEPFDDRKTGHTENKPVLSFERTEKRLILNKTNGRRIAELHGPRIDDWKGQEITLITDKVDAFGELTDAIRVSLDPPQRTGSNPTPQPQVGMNPQQQPSHAAPGSTGDDDLPFAPSIH